MQYFFILYIIMYTLFSCSFAMAQEATRNAWYTLGLSAEQVQHKNSATESVFTGAKHKLIVQKAVFPFSEPTPVAMSPNKKKFYMVSEGKVAAYAMPSGRRLWETSTNFYENSLLATNTGVYAEYFNTDAHRLYGTGIGAGGIHFFSSAHNLLYSLEHVSIIPAMSQDGAFVALQGDSFGEISVLNTKTFETEELAIDMNLSDEMLREMEPWNITMLYYEKLSHEDYTRLQENFWTQYGITPLLKGATETQDTYTLYTLPENTIQYPTLNIQCTAFSVQKEYALAGDSPHIFIVHPLTGKVQVHELKNTKEIQALSFSADGKSLVAINDAGVLHIYKEGQWQQKVTAIQGSIYHMVVDTHGDTVWITQEDILHAISLKTSKILSRRYTSLIYAMAFSPKLQKMVFLTQNEANPVPAGFTSLLSTDSEAAFYSWEKMQALCILLPELQEKEILSFTAENLLLRNAFAETRVADGTRIHFDYNTSSTPAQITLQYDAEYFSLEHMHALSHFSEAAPHVYVKLPKFLNTYVDMMAVYNINSEKDTPFLSIPQYRYPNISKLTEVHFTQQGSFISRHEDDSIILWDITKKTSKPLLTYNFFKDGNYIITNEFGNFFSPSEEKFAAFHWVNNESPSEIIGFEKLADRYRDINIIENTLGKR